MPDFTIEVMGICPQYSATFEVPGSSGTYRVSLGPDGAYCPCRSYQYCKDEYDRTCKHIKLVRSHGCLYDPQGREPGPNDLQAQGIKILSQGAGYGESCPGCGEEMQPIRVAV